MIDSRKTVEQANWGESEIRGPVHLFRERLLMRLFCSLQPHGTVLDAGCGSGSMAFDLCAAGYDVEAVEDAEAGVCPRAGFKHSKYGKLVQVTRRCAAAAQERDSNPVSQWSFADYFQWIVLSIKSLRMDWQNYN